MGEKVFSSMVSEWECTLISTSCYLNRGVVHGPYFRCFKLKILVKRKKRISKNALLVVLAALLIYFWCNFDIPSERDKTRKGDSIPLALISEKPNSFIYESFP